MKINIILIKALFPILQISQCVHKKIVKPYFINNTLSAVKQLSFTMHPHLNQYPGHHHLIDPDAYDSLYNDFCQRLESSNQNHHRAIDTYIYVPTSDPMARHRKVLGCYLNLIISWREFANFAEVALGSGNMLDFPPLYEHKIVRFWTEPVMVLFYECLSEVNSLIKFSAFTIERARIIINENFGNGEYNVYFG